MDIMEFCGALITITFSIFIFWIMIIGSIAICSHKPVPAKRLICLNKNHTSYLVDDCDWKEIVENAEELT
jgi:hypothetical protein